jgi:hypothetical protein
MSDPLEGIPSHLRSQVHADEYGYWASRLTAQDREQYLGGLQAKYDAAQKAESASASAQRLGSDNAGEKDIDPTRAKPGMGVDPKPASAKQVRDSRLLTFMPQQLRAEYETADPERKAMLWEANRSAFEEAKERKRVRLLAEQVQTQRILDMLQRLREDPSKAHLLPPDDASMADLLKWHEEMSKPDRKGLPFPTEGGGRPDYGNPPDSELGLNFVRDSRTREVGPRAGTPTAAIERSRSARAREGLQEVEQGLDPMAAILEDKSGAIPGREQPPKPPSRYQGLFDQPPDRSHHAWGWNGTAVFVAILTLVFWGALFVLAWVFYCIWIYRAPWFPTLEKPRRTAIKVALSTMIGVGLLLLWLFIPAPFNITSGNETLRQNTITTATVSPTPSPNTSPTITPTISSPRPTPPATALTDVPISFDRTVVIKGGGVYRLDSVMVIAGFRGSPLLQTLYIHNKDQSDRLVCWGDQPQVNATTGSCLMPEDGFNFPGGRDSRQVYLFADKDVRLYISALSR